MWFLELGAAFAAGMIVGVAGLMLSAFGVFSVMSDDEQLN